MSPSGPPPRRLIIDTDAGIDDMLGLALAVRSPEVHLIAVTTVFGNTTLRQATRNARHLLRLAGSPYVPLFPGSAIGYRWHAPEGGTTTDGAPSGSPMHGTNGVGDAPVPPTGLASTVPSPRALVDGLRLARGPVTLVTLGPLTNLAHALDADEPLVRRRVARHIGVFGTVVQRASPSRPADFNAWTDPEAADRVVRARLPTVAVTLDVTRGVVLPGAAAVKMRTTSQGLRAWLLTALRFYVEQHRARFNLDGCFLHDPLAVAAAIAPDLLQTEHRAVSVDLDGRTNRGHTRGTRFGTPLEMATTVDIDRLRRILVRLFGTAHAQARRHPL